MFGTLVFRPRRKYLLSWKSIYYGAFTNYPVENAAALESLEPSTLCPTCLFSLSNKLQAILLSLISAAKACSDSLSIEMFVVFSDSRPNPFHFHLSKIHLVQVLLFTWWTWHSSPMLSFVCLGQIPGWPVLCTCSFSIPWPSSSFSVTMGCLEQSACHKDEESCFTF